METEEEETDGIFITCESIKGDGTILIKHLIFFITRENSFNSVVFTSILLCGFKMSQMTTPSLSVVLAT